MKNDKRALEKSSSVVIAPFAHAFIFDETKSGNSIGEKNISSKIVPKVIPVIFKTLKRVFFIDILIWLWFAPFRFL